MEFPSRINKYLAHIGVSTRRGADTLIESGAVFVNGKRAIIGQTVEEGDRVEVRGKDEKKYRYILYYKPRGVITHSPEGDEIDIETRIRKDHSITGVFPVGRLDKDSEGLIVLTNDGRITERLLSPDREHEKTYEVTVDKRVTGTFVKALSQGVRIEGYKTKKAVAAAHAKNEKGFTITLTEGKKHQIRRMCAALGYQVKSIKRTHIMHLELKRLCPGQYYELKKPEVYALYSALGLAVPTPKK